MKAKEKNKKIKITLKSIIYVGFLFFIILYTYMFYQIYIYPSQEKTLEVSTDITNQNKSAEGNEIKISKAEKIDENYVENIIQNQIDQGIKTELVQTEETLEYLTQYRTNIKIPKGISYVVQEGRTGTQKITTQKEYKNGELISQEQINASIEKAALNKIIEIGGATYTNSYKVKKGDTVYITTDILELKSEPNQESEKLKTLIQNQKLVVLDIKDSWYQVTYQTVKGWIKAECTTFIEPNSKEDKIEEKATTKTKQELMSTLSFQMKLNKPSGLTLEQFKKVLRDDKDENKIFENNAEYFYYIEKQYSINGIFVASIGVHESNWGTSNIALQKNNLFGYGAYDSNPYNGAYKFSNYSESIDLLARVLVKYYLNPKGTAIYGGEKAIGSYYNGANLSGVNQKYATDKNWANAVYRYMQYFYNKL